MPGRPQLDRRTFLRGAGVGALLGASGLRPLSAESWISGATPTERRLFDFDQILDRRGTDCTKWDGAEATMGHPIEYGMGIADTDFAGTNLLDGSTGSVSFKIGTGADPSSDELAVGLSETTVSALSLTGANVLTSGNADAAVGAINNAIDSILSLIHI